jgi:hypothetical protein
MEPEHIHVILGGLLDIANRNLWNRLRKVREHVFQLTPMDFTGWEWEGGSRVCANAQSCDKAA